jgi:hypothetical protein
MVEKKEESAQDMSFLISDFNIRLRDLEEKNQLMRERVLLLGKNLLVIKDESFNEIDSLKKQVFKLTQEMERTRSSMQSLVSEIGNFAKKSELLVVERMLRDFQPLEFARIKDVQDIVEDKIADIKEKSKNIKTKKPTETE